MCPTITALLLLATSEKSKAESDFAAFWDATWVWLVERVGLVGALIILGVGAVIFFVVKERLKVWAARPRKAESWPQTDVPSAPSASRSITDPTPAEAAPPPPTAPRSTGQGRSPRPSMSASATADYRFEIAISFAGDNKLDLVRRVAEILRDEVGEGKIFFYEWFQAELAGHDLQVVLQNIYKNQTRLVVTCVCQRYQDKPWTQEEWRAIQSFERGLRDAGSANVKRLRLLPLRFGDGQVDGLFDTAGVPDVRSSSPEAIAGLILERLRLAKGDPRSAATETLPTQDDVQRYLDLLIKESKDEARRYSPLYGVADITPDDVLLDDLKDDPNVRYLVYQSLEHTPDPEAPRTKPREYEDILDAFDDVDVKQAALLGAPGSGKSTTLRKLAVQLAERAKKDPVEPLPLFVKLGSWEGDEPLSAFLTQNVPVIGSAVETLMRKGTVVLLLDGLNEVPAAKRKTKAAQIAALKSALPKGTPLIVSCRAHDYGDLNLKFDTLSLEPLSPRRVRDALRQWVADKGEVLEVANKLFWQLAGDERLAGVMDRWLAAVGTDDAFDVFWSNSNPWEDERARAHLGWVDRDLWRRCVSDPRSLLRLAANPLMLTMLFSVWVAGRRKLPRNRGDLFKTFVDNLLSREELLVEDSETGVWQRTTEGEQLLGGLTELAWAMQSERIDAGPSESGDFGVLTVVSQEAATETLRDEALLKKALGCTLLEGPEKIRFRHQLLQEYFTAEAMKGRIPGTPATEFWPAERWWERTGWEESAILLAGFYPDNCSPIIRWLADAQPEVATQCILDSGAGIPQKDKDVLLKELQAAWMPRLTDIEREPRPEARAAVGRALGRLDLDNREGVGLRADGLPDIDWVEIPGGKFIYQDGEHRETETFFMARYPVTNAQFRAFLNAEDGYRDDRWWKDMDKPVREEAQPAWSEPNHPRETVSWYEAVAFCNWLGDRRGEDMRLPTEEQWERAARGTKGRVYPWGDDYEAGRANIDEITWGEVGPHRVGRTTAVGVYLQGATPLPEQVMDLSGNVWEWCLNEYVKPKRTQRGGRESRVVRGGSWYHDQDLARADYRDNFLPFGRINLLGFRVVSSSPIR